MCDLICDIIICCVSSCDTGKINACDEIVIDNKNKKIGKSKKCLHKSATKRWFRNEIHRFLRQADARESADIIYCM